MAFMRRRTHQQTMVMKMIARGSKVDSTFSNVPSSWGELKAVALMLPHPRMLKKGPIDPAWLFDCAKKLDIDITPEGFDHLLLPFVIAFARAPLPCHWEPITRGELTKDEKIRNPKWLEPPPSDEFVYAAPKMSSRRSDVDFLSARRGSTSPFGAPGSAPAGLTPAQSSFLSPAAAVGAPGMPPAAPPPPQQSHSSRRASEQDEEEGDPNDILDVYENTLTKERKHGHPGAQLVLPTVRGIQVRAARTLKPSPTDGWVQFVDKDGELFFYNFRDKTRSAFFPTLHKGDVPKTVLPPRRLEPTAEKMCAAGEKILTSTLSFAEAIEEAKKLLHEPIKASRGVTLAHSPTPLDEILINAQYAHPLPSLTHPLPQHTHHSPGSHTLHTHSPRSHTLSSTSLAGTSASTRSITAT